jgi:hypothetical protein
MNSHIKIRKKDIGLMNKIKNIINFYKYITNIFWINKWEDDKKSLKECKHF